MKLFLRGRAGSELISKIELLAVKLFHWIELAVKLFDRDRTGKEIISKG